MGLFSKKTKAPKPAAISKSVPGDGNSTTASLHSTPSYSNLKSPTSRMAGSNRTSGGGSVPGTPMTPFSPVIPKVDLPKPPDPNLDPAAYLRSLGAVRERSRFVTEKAMRNKLHHFDVDLSKFGDVVTFVCGIIKVCLHPLYRSKQHIAAAISDGAGVSIHLVHLQGVCMIC